RHPAAWRRPPAARRARGMRSGKGVPIRSFAGLRRAGCSCHHHAFRPREPTWSPHATTTPPTPMPLPDITRRDFLNGVALAAAPPAAAAETTASASTDPIALRTGLQGQTDAVNAHAHAWRDDPARFRDAAAEVDPDVEDLVVVGAGLSGL